MEITLANPVISVIPLFFLCILLEIIYTRVRGIKGVYDLSDSLVNGFMAVGIIIIENTLKFLSAGVILYFSYNSFNEDINGIMLHDFGYRSFGWNWYVWICCMLCNEFSHYWVHRFNHTVRFMWAAHVVHHSSEHFNLSTSFRLSWISKLYKPFFFAWIAAIGFHPEMILYCYGVQIVYQFFLHTSLSPKFKGLEKVFNTPKLHQVHHATNVIYLDKNHGAILSIFDRIFGSWQPYVDDIKIEYGLTHKPDSNRPENIILHEYKNIFRDLKKARSFYEGFMYVFGPPGWSIDGSTLTVRQIQKT